MFSKSGLRCSASTAAWQMKHKPPQPRTWTKILPWRKRLEEKAKPKVAVLNLHGMIAASTGGLNRGRNLSIHSTQKLIDKAFSTPKCEAVFLSINSPGGSAVQSELIADYIGIKAAEKKVPVISFVEDVAASGGYWLATAGPTIYCSKRFLKDNEIICARILWDPYERILQIVQKRSLIFLQRADADLSQ